MSEQDKGVSQLLAVLKSAGALFTLRNEITAILIEKLSVNSEGEIEGHDEAAEEIIFRIGAEQ